MAYDLNPAAIEASEADGARGRGTPQQVVDALTLPRHVWLMVPAAYVGSTIEAFAPLLSPGDTLIDGGNSWYRDDVDRAGPLRELGINYLDVGTSGGVFGLDRGYCLMVGGDPPMRSRRWRRSSTTSPRVRAAERTPGYAGDPHPRREGLAALRAQRRRPLRQDGSQWDRVRPDGRTGRGAQRPGRGRHRCRRPPEGRRDGAARSPGVLPSTTSTSRAIAEVWRRGSVVSSWLLDLTAAALAADPELKGFEGVVSDSGEGRWTIHAAIDEGVPAPVLSGGAVRTLRFPRTVPTPPTRSCPPSEPSSEATSKEQATTNERFHATTRRRAWCCSAPPVTSPSASCFRRCIDLERHGKLNDPGDRSRPQRLDGRDVPQELPREAILAAIPDADRA